MPKATANTRSQYLEDVAIDLPAGRDPQRLEHRQVARQPDGERGQHDVEPDGEGELRAGQQDRVCFRHANLARLPARQLWPAPRVRFKPRGGSPPAHLREAAHADHLAEVALPPNARPRRASPPWRSRHAASRRYGATTCGRDQVALGKRLQQAAQQARGGIGFKHETDGDRLMGRHGRKLRTNDAKEKGGSSPAAQAAGPLIRVLIVRSEHDSIVANMPRRQGRNALF